MFPYVASIFKSKLRASLRHFRHTLIESVATQAGDSAFGNQAQVDSAPSSFLHLTVRYFAANGCLPMNAGRCDRCSNAS